MPELSVLLVGSYPPPHGGVSVHVASLQRALVEAGVRADVLNLDPRASPSSECLTISGGLDLVRQVAAHAREGRVVHLHTNGHNVKSWLIALAVGLAARRAPRRVLTLHSGMLPAFLAAGGPGRLLARLAARLYSAIVAVSPEVDAALRALGVPAARLTMRPAFLPPHVAPGTLPAELDAWMSSRYPLLSTALFYRPEYGLDVLLEAAVRLRREYPRLGALVLGSGDAEGARALVRLYGLEDAIRLVGDFDHGECLKVMARSDVFVRPTRADGDSISVREALALGVRTVASRVGQRPPGARLFAPGEAEDLVRAVSESLAGPAPAAGTDGVDTVSTLLALYGHRLDPEIAPAPAQPEGVRTDARALVRG